MGTPQRRYRGATAAIIASASVLLATGIATDAQARWSAPATLEACPGGAPQIVFPSDSPRHGTARGAVLWVAGSACAGGGGARVASISTAGRPGAPVTAMTVKAPALKAAIAQLSGNAPPGLAVATGYLGDVAIASAASADEIEFRVRRYFSDAFAAPRTVSAAAGAPVRALALALDYRTDALLAWAQGGSIYARALAQHGTLGPLQRLGSGGADAEVRVLASDAGRGIVVWMDRAAGTTSVYADVSGVRMIFGAPRLLERFRDPGGVRPPDGSLRLVRLASESVLLAWSGVGAGHYVVRAAAVSPRGVRKPRTISGPGANALLADLEPGPYDEALALWTEPAGTHGPSPAHSGTADDSRAERADEPGALYAARGIDVGPGVPLFTAPERVAGAGEVAALSANASVALDPDKDRAVAAWRAPDGALRYALREAGPEPSRVRAQATAGARGGGHPARWIGLAGLGLLGVLGASLLTRRRARGAS